ncbi:Fe-S cluster assembly protein SufD [Vulcanimicrobium alpinum]|uniref:Fe-S cluster assembly protein SufD n=1 Tax=Vulcanimicrobium alpinum TaxID=3016050 RepID=A0AAN1XWT4_UNVUL|nr:Fe-S cluster assembly protein SufD [Vulcanimicrobium alpinum]BDE05737.1 Fe-S cluster assembly protein SufD [Vulcanimicrobium alpinum]
MPNTAAAETLAAIPFAPTRPTLDAAIDALDALGSAGGGAVDAQARRDAFARYEELPVPGMRPGRGWKHDYAKLAFDDLTWASGRREQTISPLAALAVRGAERAVARDDASLEIVVDRPALETANAGGLVHLGAVYLDAPVDAPDSRVVVLPLADARASHGELLAAVLHRIVDPRGDRFAALAAAFQNCGAFVYVPDGVVLDAPIQLVFANSEARDEAIFPHIVVVLGRGARATVIERHLGDGAPFVCGIVEAQVGERAQLDYVTVQQLDEQARIAFTRSARCERDGAIRWHLAELGATLARTVLGAQLDAEGANADTSALFFNTRLQHVDLQTSTIHAVGNTTSDTVVRSAATDRGQGRYIGNIVIRPKAHGSDASLRDDALLLSKRAHIDSIPALEIAANDVKAFHGATVGSLDEDALFYTSSRGIARPEALRMITLGFFEPVIGRFPSEALRDEVRSALDGKIDDATELD